MRRLLFVAAFLLLAPAVAYAYQSPGAPNGFVNDFADIIPADAEVQLESNLAAFEQQTSHEVAVVTVPSLGDETIESYSIKLAEEWKVGKRGSDNGVILLVAPTEHQVRIEVGYGLEGVLTDAVASRIIRGSITPAFKKDDYAGGINAGVAGILSASRGEVIPEPDSVKTKTAPSLGLFAGLFALVHMALMGLGLFPRTKSWWLGGIVGAFYGLFGSAAFGSLAIGMPLFIVLGLVLDFVYSRFLPTKIFRGGSSGGSGWGSGGSGGWSSGSGGSSSSGSFGGGSFGGGGSSGSW